MQIYSNYYFENPILDDDDMALEGKGDFDVDNNGEFMCAT